MSAEVCQPYLTVDQVDDNLLRRFNELVEGANAEDMAKLLESWSKYLSARRNNDLLTHESADEKAERETAEILEGLVK